MQADYVITEWGGVPSDTPDGTALSLNVAEKGVAWQRLKVKGTPSHGSMPWGTDNALIKAAEIVRRLAEYRPTPDIHELWKRQVENLHFDAEIKEAMLDPDRLDDVLKSLPDQMHARTLHACSHTTFSPNVAHGGSKTNTVPDEVIIEVDIRTLPGETPDDVNAHLPNCSWRSHLRRTRDRADPSRHGHGLPNRDTALGRTQRAHAVRSSWRHDSAIADHRRHRRSLLSPGWLGCLRAPHCSHPAMKAEVFADRFHGNDERIDVESIGLTTELFYHTAQRMLS